MLLNERFLEVQVDTIRLRGESLPGLRVGCKATKTLKPEPNECTLTIYNLSDSSRASLTRVKRPVVSVTAGYKGETTSVFYGQAVHVKHERSGPDILTTVSTSDGGRQKQAARVKQNFGPGTKPGQVLRAIAKALNLKPGNIEATARKLDLGKAATLYTEGVTLTGHASHALDMLCRSAGLEWSIQDGALQFLDIGKANGSVAIVLGPSLLIGTPSISDSNVVEGQTFLQKDFLPGRQIQVKHPFVSGAFRLEKCVYDFDTHAETWAVSFEAKGPKP